MGVIGNGPDAVTWVKPSYLDQAAEEHSKEYEKLKERFGEGNFIYAVDLSKIPMRDMIDRRRFKEASDADSDRYSLVRNNWKRDPEYVHPGRIGKPEFEKENAGKK